MIMLRTMYTHNIDCNKDAKIPSNRSLLDHNRTPYYKCPMQVDSASKRAMQEN